MIPSIPGSDSSRILSLLVIPIPVPDPGKSGIVTPLIRPYLEDNPGPEPREHVQTQGPRDPLLLLAFARHAAASVAIQ